ncbi:MAG: adenylate/guanylate cyclase domain-containing protein [Candidatus Latescibacteria bacterium]|jgi:adenylate cyclase|nr:adenylate/guanylate cyclase domain-containing protein [Candidatus Latescibacterota bacterium]
MKPDETVPTDLVILFTDVHNFSIAATSLGSKQAEFLQEMYVSLGDAILARGGTLVKYIGDAMLATFPGGHEGAAVDCAIELRDRFGNIVSEGKLPGEVELEVAIGSGEVITGEFGHPSLRMKDIFGDAVNRTATIGHHRGIAITERVFQRVKDIHRTRELVALRVKWQDAPLQRWEILV